MMQSKVEIHQFLSRLIKCIEFNFSLTGRALVEKNLLEKKADIKNLTENHELDMNVLRQTNEELQENIVRVERERQLLTVIESAQLKAQAEREKNSMIKSHEDAIRTDSAEKEEQIAQLVKKVAEEQKRHQRASAAHEDHLAAIRSQHLEKEKNLRREHDMAIAAKVKQFNAEKERLEIINQNKIFALKEIHSQLLKKAEEELNKASAALN